MCHPSSMHQINDTQLTSYGVWVDAGGFCLKPSIGQFVTGQRAGQNHSFSRWSVSPAQDACYLAKRHGAERSETQDERGGGAGVQQSRTPTLTSPCSFLRPAMRFVTKKPIVGCLAPWTNRLAGLSSQSSIDDGAVRASSRCRGHCCHEDCLGCWGSSILRRKTSFSSKSDQDCRPIERWPLV